MCCHWQSAPDTSHYNTNLFETFLILQLVIRTIPSSQYKVYFNRCVIAEEKKLTAFSYIATTREKIVYIGTGYRAKLTY